MVGYILVFVFLIVGVFYMKRLFYENRFFRLLVPVVFLLFSYFVVYNYIGWSGGTPQLSKYENIFFEEQGIYAVDGSIDFRYHDEKENNRLEGLNNGEFIKLYPVVKDYGKIKKWRVDYRVTQPLRLKKKAINIKENQWLDYGDTLCIALNKNPNLQLDLILQKGDKCDNYILNYRNYSTAVLERSDTINFPRIRDGVFLERITKRAIGDGETREDYYSRYAVLDSLRNRFFLFRESKDTLDSRLRFNIDQNGCGFKIKKISGNLSYRIVESPESDFIELSPSDRLQFGYGLDVQGFRLSDSNIAIKGGAKMVAPIYFSKTKRFNLPRERVVKDFFITTQSGYIDRDYVFRLPKGDNMSAIYAIAKMNETLDSVKVNSGRYVQSIAMGESFMIDNGKQGYVLKFDQFHFIYMNFPLPLLVGVLLLLTFFLIGIVLYDEADSLAQSKVLLIWSLVNFLVIFLGIIKLIITYRIAAFPPISANIRELSLLSKSLRISVLALIFIPWGYAITNVKRIASFDLLKYCIVIVILWSLLWLIPGSVISFSIASMILLVAAFLLRDYFNERSLVKEYLKRWDRSENGECQSLKESFLFRNWWWIAIVLISGIVVVLGFFTNSDGAVLKVRYNILSIIALFLICYLFSSFQKKNLSQKQLLSNGVFYYAVVAVVGGSNVFLSKDVGFALVYFPVFMTFPLLWNKLDDLKRKYRIIPYLVALGVLGGMLLGPDIYLNMSPEDNSAYRLNADNPNYWYDFNNEANIDFDETLFKNNSYQMWQLKNYASNGGSLGVGYGKAEFINTGVTIPVSLTDGLFASYVVSEFGYLGGIGINVLFVLLFVLLILMALRLQDVNYHLIWFIIAVGLYFLHSTIYMSMVNVGAYGIPFTGQNIPFFSLLSRSDSFHFLFLIAIVGLVLMNVQSYNSDIYEYRKEGYKLSYRTIWGVVAVYFIFELCLFIALINCANSKEAISDFKLPQKYVEEFEEYVNNRYLTYQHDSLVQSNDKEPLSIFFQEHIKRFNNRSREYQQKAELGLIYIDEHNRIKLNKHYYKVRSPFNRKSPWSKTIYASNKDSVLYQLNFINTASSIGMMDDDSQMETVILPDELVDAKKTMGPYIQFKDKNSNILVEIERDSLGVILKANQKNIAWINGKELDSGNYQKDTLTPNDIVVLQLPNSELKHYLCLEKTKGEKLSRLSWVNGAPKRIYRLGEAFPFAYNLTNASSMVDLNNDLMLTINKELQCEIQSAINDYASANIPFKVRGDELHKAKQIAFTVMDSYSGRVLAMGSWPNFDPNDEKLNKYMNKLTPLDQGRVLYNSNLRKHVIGSTFKPLTFAAMSLSFNPRTSYDLGGFEVCHFAHNLNRGDDKRFKRLKAKNRVKNILHPHHYLSGINFDITNGNDEFWDCENIKHMGWIDKEAFMTYSLNYYQMALFSLGLVHRSEMRDINKFHFRTNTSDKKREYIRFSKRKPFYLDVSSSRLLGDQNSRQGFVTGMLPESVVFNNMSDLYSVNLERDGQVNRYDKLSSTWSSSLSSFLPSFANESNANLKMVTPEPVNMDVDVLRNRRDLRLLMIGGGDHNRWNNIHVCEAFARISTGQYTNATLEKRKVDSSELLPYPLSSNWRDRNLFPGLIGSYSIGTSSSCFPRTIHNSKLKVIAKTGTIQERTPNRECELLVYTIGARDKTKNEFLPGETVTCYLFMEDAHLSGSRKWQRGPLNSILSEKIREYINSLHLKEFSRNAER